MAVYVNSRRRELMDDALRKLHLKSGTAKAAEAEADIEQIVTDYRKLVAEAKALPGIGEARERLRDWAGKLHFLAQEFRGRRNVLIVSLATHNPTDSDDAKKNKSAELVQLQSALLADADRLDDIAKRLRGQADQWGGKPTGELDAYRMVHDAPKYRLAVDCVRLLARHRQRKDIAKTGGGDAHIFLQRVYELATERKPKNSELLFDLRKAINAWPSDH